MRTIRTKGKLTVQHLPALIRLLVRPLVGYCLRQRVPIQDLFELLKEEYLRSAVEQLERKKERVTTSRLSLMTGIHRRDVTRLTESPELSEFQATVLVRVVALWQHDPRFQTTRHEPRVLTFGTVGSEFHELVAAVHREFNPATILSELEHTGVVTRTARGIRLELQSYSPRGNPEQGFAILSRDIQDLISVVDRNTAGNESLSNLHVRTEYDRVRASAIPEIRRWLLQEGHNFHRKVREMVSKFDQDISPTSADPGPVVRVAVGSFGIIDEGET